MAQTFENQEHVPLTLFQVIARSECTVHVRVIDGNGKFATVEVLEKIHGEPPAERLRIDYRDLNLVLKGQEVVIFSDGEEYVLFLTRPLWRKPKEKNRDILALYHGRRGRILLPPEGSGPQLEAVRSLARLVGEAPDDQLAGLRSLMIKENPILRMAAMDEVGRLHGVTPEDLPALSRILLDPDPGIRGRALGLVRGVIIEPASEEVATIQRTVLETCRQMARNDPAFAVRVQAVKVLGTWKEPAEVAGDLRTIAASDTSQEVRYEAQRALYRRGLLERSPQP